MYSNSNIIPWSKSLRWMFENCNSPCQIKCHSQSTAQLSYRKNHKFHDFTVALSIWNPMECEGTFLEFICDVSDASIGDVVFPKLIALIKAQKTKILKDTLDIVEQEFNTEQSS